MQFSYEFEQEILAPVEVLKNKVSNVSSGVSRNEIEEMVREEFEETQGIEERKFNIMCFGLEERSALNAEMKTKEDEDFRTSISKMLIIGRPVIQENQDKPVDLLGGAAPFANDRNDQGTKKKRRRTVRTPITDADQKKKDPCCTQGNN